MINPFSVVTTLQSVNAAPAGRRSSAVHGRFIRPAYRFANVHRRCVRTWDTVFPNASCAVALIDRLTHHAEIIAIEGESYRKREAERTQKSRR